METLQTQSRSLSATSLNNDEKKLIAVNLGKLVLLRQEKISNYNFEIWFEYFEEKGMSFPEVMQAVKMAGDLKRYGGNLLSVGDVVDNFEANIEVEKSVSWTTFLRMLSTYEKKAGKDIDKLCGRHIPLKDYYKHQIAIEEYIDKTYLKPSDSMVAEIAKNEVRAQWLKWLKAQVKERDTIQGLFEKIEELENILKLNLNEN